MALRKSRNSSWRCLGTQVPTTFPVAAFKAAKGVVVPLCLLYDSAKSSGSGGTNPDDEQAGERLPVRWMACACGTQKARHTPEIFRKPLVICRALPVARLALVENRRIAGFDQAASATFGEEAYAWTCPNGI